MWNVEVESGKWDTRSFCQSLAGDDKAIDLEQATKPWRLGELDLD
jgi:hypothetical protein